MVENIGNNEFGIERDGDLAIVRTPRGVHQILYETHTKPVDPELFTEVPQGLFMESGITPYTQFNTQTLNEALAYPTRHKRESYARKYNIPLFYHDVASNNKGIALQVGEPIQTVTESFTGLTTLTMLAEHVHRAGIQRDDLLPFSLMTIGSLWLYTTPFSPFMPKDMAKRLLAVHPEAFRFTLKLRNALMAYKQQWFMNESGGNPNFGTVLGHGHVGIESDFQKKPEDNLALLRKYRWLLTRVSHLEELYSIAQANYSRVRHEWELTQVFEVPELKKIFS